MSIYMACYIYARLLLLRIIRNIVSVMCVGRGFPMYVCHCNPFSDKDAQAYLETKAGQKVRLRELYQACTGGARPPCGIACIPRLKEIVQNHNRAVGGDNGAVDNSLDDFIPAQP